MGWGRVAHRLESGTFLTTVVLPVTADATFIERRYVVLPKSIYDIDMDGGIQSMCYYDAEAITPEFALVTFHRTDDQKLRWLSGSEYQKPRASHPYFRREGKRLYLEGIKATVPNVEVKMYCNLPDLSEVDLLNLADQEFDFPKELMYPLKRAILDMGRFALALPGQYLINDGTNRPSNQVAGNPEKTMSVNDPLVNTATDANA
jgi:hypothetical protein